MGSLKQLDLTSSLYMAVVLKLGRHELFQRKIFNSETSPGSSLYVLYDFFKDEGLSSHVIRWSGGES